MARPRTPAAKPQTRPIPIELNECVRALGLSPRQAGIVQLILRGKKDKEIAAEMGLSKHTVRTYLKRTFERLDVTDRTTLVVRVLLNQQMACPHKECPYKP